VTVKKLVTAIEPAGPDHPITASGQVEGAMLQSLGYALTEDLVLDARASWSTTVRTVLISGGRRPRL